MTLSTTRLIVAFGAAVSILVVLSLWSRQRAEDAARERQRLEQTQQELERTRSALEQSRESLEQTRERLEQSRTELDQSVGDALQRTETLNEAVQASRDYEFEQRRKAARARAFFNGLSAANAIKVAMTEYYQTEGRWPSNNADMELPRPSAYSTKEVYDVSIEPRGRIHVAVNDEEQRAKLILYATATQAGTVNWRCVSPTTRDIEEIVPSCTYGN